MAPYLHLNLLTITLLLLSTTTLSTPPVLNPSVSPATSPHDIHDSFTPTSILEPVLSNLGFHELAMAVPSLSDDSSFTTWNGPTTLFAPTDVSIRSCSSCSVVRLLREHIVPGLFSHDYLAKLAFGTKIETMDPGRCITVTSSNNNNNNYTKIFIGGVEITRPDLFNNGLVVIHGLQGYVAPLSPFSCNVERMTSLSFPVNDNNNSNNNRESVAAQQTAYVNNYPAYVMRLMIRDAMLRLRNSGFSILALAMKMKSLELLSLNNMTVFALDDVSIFSGSHSYVNNVRFHVIPNRLLAIADLEKVSSGTLLPTLEPGQSLMVTTPGGGFNPLRINYVRIKVPDVMRNLKIVVHSVYLPFPHLHPSTISYEESGVAVDNASDACLHRVDGSCGVGTSGGIIDHEVVKMEHQGL